ncbi:MAG: hypothetical protein JNM17_17610 [Archangium sp.]|nr:hypothetical protein [Archangium sp.]
MDLVGAYVSELGLPENAARGLAGQFLGLIEDTVREKVSFGIAAKIRDAVPEMAQWQLAAPTLRPGTLSLNDLAGTSMLDPKAERDSLLNRFSVPAARAAKVQSLALAFLSTRVEPSVLAAVTKALP